MVSTPTTLPTGAPANSSFSDYILGTGYDKVPKTPQWASAICGVPARKIIALAKDWASHTINVALACQPQRTSYGIRWPPGCYSSVSDARLRKARRAVGTAYTNAFPGKLAHSRKQYLSISAGVSLMSKQYHKPNVCLWFWNYTRPQLYYVNRMLFTIYEERTSDLDWRRPLSNAADAFQTHTVPPNRILDGPLVCSPTNTAIFLLE